MFNFPTHPEKKYHGSFLVLGKIDKMVICASKPDLGVMIGVKVFSFIKFRWSWLESFARLQPDFGDAVLQKNSITSIYSCK